VKPVSELLAEVEPVDRTGLVCLVPRKEAGGITCHEKTLCDCQVLEIADRLDKLKAIAVELAKACEVIKYNHSTGMDREFTDREKCERVSVSLNTARKMLGEK